MQLLEKSKIILATDYILVKTHCCIATELWSTITRKIIIINTTEKDLIRLRQEDSEFKTSLDFTVKKNKSKPEWHWIGNSCLSQEWIPNPLKPVQPPPLLVLNSQVKCINQRRPCYWFLLRKSIKL